MYTVSMKTLITVLLFGSVTTALDERQHVLVGSVREVDAAAHRIVIRTESGAETLLFQESTKLIGQRPESKVKDVMPGDNIIVLCSGKRGGKRIQEVKNMKLSHKIKALEGTVVHVYKFTRLVFIKMSDGKEEIFRIAENAMLVLNGQLVSLSELAVEQGERVTVYYTEDLSLKTVQALEGQKYERSMSQKAAAGQKSVRLLDASGLFL